MAAQYQQAVSRVHIAAEAAAEDAWYSYDSIGSEDEDEWNLLFWGIVLAAATSVAIASREYMQNQLAYVGLAAPLPTPDMGWLEADFDNYKTSPMIFTRWQLSEGQDITTALFGGGSRASKLMSAVVRESEQRAFEQLIDSDAFKISWEYRIDDENLVPIFPASQERADELAKEKGAIKRATKSKFKRVPQADACGWCKVAADRVYSYEAKQRHPLGAWHTYCRCTWRKMTSAEVAAFEPQYGDGKWRTVIKERFDETGDENA